MTSPSKPSVVANGGHNSVGGSSTSSSSAMTVGSSVLGSSRDSSNVAPPPTDDEIVPFSPELVWRSGSLPTTSPGHPTARPSNPLCRDGALPVEDLDNFRILNYSALQRYCEPATVHKYSVASGKWFAHRTTVVVSNKPFARGCMRSGYYCLDSDDPSQLLVAKRYRRDIPAGQYFVDAHMHTLAAYWADSYNRYEPPKRVRFVDACVVELTHRTPKLFLGLEPFLAGTFVKHNSNNGYVNEEDRRCTPQAFLHFTYHYSGRMLLICDIQGVGDVYTDPQVHTCDGKGYGRGNLGEKGMMKCLRAHTCNAVCRRLKLPPVATSLAAHGIVKPQSDAPADLLNAKPANPLADAAFPAFAAAPGRGDEGTPADASSDAAMETVAAPASTPWMKLRRLLRSFGKPPVHHRASEAGVVHIPTMSGRPAGTLKVPSRDTTPPAPPIHERIHFTHVGEPAAASPVEPHDLQEPSTVDYPPGRTTGRRPNRTRTVAPLFDKSLFDFAVTAPAEGSPPDSGTQFWES